jgi:hypothetical protein
MDEIAFGCPETINVILNLKRKYAGDGELSAQVSGFAAFHFLTQPENYRHVFLLNQIGFCQSANEVQGVLRIAPEPQPAP